MQNRIVARFLEAPKREDILEGFYAFESLSRLNDSNRVRFESSSRDLLNLVAKAKDYRFSGIKLERDIRKSALALNLIVTDACQDALETFVKLPKFSGDLKRTLSGAEDIIKGLANEGAAPPEDLLSSSDMELFVARLSMRFSRLRTTINPCKRLFESMF